MEPLLLSVWPTPLALPDRKMRPAALSDLGLVTIASITPNHLARAIHAFTELLKGDSLMSLSSSCTSRTTSPQTRRQMNHLLHQSSASLQLALVASIMKECTDDALYTHCLRTRAYILAFITPAHAEHTEWLIPQAEWLLWCEILNVVGTTWKLIEQPDVQRAARNFRRIRLVQKRMHARSDGSYWMSAARWIAHLDVCAQALAYVSVARGAAEDALKTMDLGACATVMACPLSASLTDMRTTTDGIPSSSTTIQWDDARQWGVMGAPWSILEKTPSPWWDEGSQALYAHIYNQHLEPLLNAQHRIKRAAQDVISTLPEPFSLLPEIPPIPLLIDEKDNPLLIGTATSDFIKMWHAEFAV